MYNEILEQQILATMLEEQYLINDSDLTTDHFTGALHRVIYQAMKELASKGRAVDASTILATVGESIGDVNYLFTLESFANVQKFDDWVSTLKESYQERKAKNVMSTALSEGWELGKVLQELAKLEMHNDNDLSTAYEQAQRLFNLPFEEKPQRVGIKTGIAQYDTITGGLMDSELTIIAARPSLGKTDVLINFAIGTQRFNKDVIALVFSLEMSDESLAERFVCNLGTINRNKLKNPSDSFTDGQKEQWSSVIGEFSAMNIHFYDKPAQTIGEIRSKVRKVSLENPTKKIVILIDYLTLIEPNDKKANTHVQVSQISKDLKNMAKEFHAPVVSLAQLSRGVEQRQDKHPMLSDLRESGSIEQDADVCVLLYRDSYYNAGMKDDRTLELNIAKQRAGQTGVILTEYNRATGRIYDKR